MIEVNPIRETERVMAEEISALARRVDDCSPTAVHVHFRDDTVVYLLEGGSMPCAGSAVSAAMDDGLDEVMQRTLGRRVAGRIERLRLAPQSVLVMVRLN